MGAVHAALFAASLLLSFILTWSVRQLAKQWGLTAPPSLSRHVHSTPVPRVGGIAIFFAVVFSLLLLFATREFWHVPISASPRKLIWLVGCAAIVFTVGLVDDLRSIGPYQKFAGQVVAALLLYAGGFKFDPLNHVLGGTHFANMLSVPLTVFWVLLITNAFNLVDGLDGLAAGSSVFSAAVLTIASLINGDYATSLPALVLTGAALGFLRFNFSPATIFLGDCGSLFLGFMLSGLALSGAQKSPTIVAVAIPLVSFGLPVLETMISVIRRFLSGKPLFLGDREHIHHRLLKRGFSHRQVVVVLYGVSALFGLVSLLFLHRSGEVVGVVLLTLGTAIWIGVQHLGYHELFELQRVARRTMEQKQVIINNLAIRRAAEELAGAESLDQIWEIMCAAFANNDLDGFELCLDMKVHPMLARSAAVERPDQKLRWHKPGLPQPQGPADWSLELQLVTSGGGRRGSLHLFRQYRDKSLLLDVNLLTAGLPQALANAIESIATRNPEEADLRVAGDVQTSAAELV